jgi:hypothetical protein
MKNNPLLTRILAILGTMLVLFPLLAPVVLSVARLIQARRFLFDYLMPAEFFPLVLIGGFLLMLAAIRMRKYRGLIGWGLGGAVLLLAGSQGLAVATGLASGRTTPGGWQWALVLAGLVAYILAVIVTGIGGVLLLRDLFKPQPAAG